MFVSSALETDTQEGGGSVLDFSIWTGGVSFETDAVCWLSLHASWVRE